MKKILILCLCLFYAGCATVPVTGRRQLSLVSDAEMQQASFASYKKVLDTSKVVRSGTDAELVKRVGSHIAKAVEQYMKQNNLSSQIEGFAWEFNLIQSSEINAWCMPGGKVVVYTGILPLTQNESGLAVVLGHEISHAIAKHSDERASESMLANGLLQAGQLMVGQNPTMANQLLLQAAGAGTQLGLLKHSRTQESEADHLGLIFMAMAGYDPNLAVPFWERMAAQGGNKPPEFLSTHPADERRVADIQKELPEALKYYKK